MHPILESLFSSPEGDVSHLFKPQVKSAKSPTNKEQDDRFWESFLCNTASHAKQDVQPNKPVQNEVNLEINFDFDQEPGLQSNIQLVESLLGDAFSSFESDHKTDHLKSVQSLLKRIEVPPASETLVHQDQIKEPGTRVDYHTIEQLLMEQSLIDLQVLSGRIHAILSEPLLDIGRHKKGVRISKTKTMHSLSKQSSYTLESTDQLTLTQSNGKAIDVVKLARPAHDSIDLTPTIDNIEILKQLHKQMSPEKIEDMNRKEAARIRANLLASRAPSTPDDSDNQESGKHISSATAASKAALYQSPQKIADTMDLDISDLERAIRERMNGSYHHRGRGR